MKLFSKFWHKDIFFYSITSIVFLILCFLPILYRIYATPPNRSYAGTIFYTDDYAVYASVIEQGINGRWTVLDKYTSEPHQSSLIHIHYLLMGKIGGVFGLSSIAIYHLNRLMLSIILLSVIILFLKKIVPGNLQKLSYLFILFSSGWPGLNPNLNDVWKKLVPQFIEPDPAIRLIHQPHFLIGAIFTLITILLFLYPPKKRIKLILILFALFSSYTAITDPAQTMISMTIAGSIMGLHFLSDDKAKLKYQLNLLLLMLISVVPVFIYLKWIRTIEPWKTIAFFDTLQEFPQKLSEFFLAFGPLSIISVVGVIFFIVQKRYINKNINYIVSSWILSSTFLIFMFSQPLGVNRNRLFHSPLYIPLSIFSVYTISTVAEFLKKFGAIPKWLTKYSLVSIFFIICLPVYFAGIIWQIKEYNTESALMYPPKTHIETYAYLKNYSDKNDVVLCLYEACNQIPFYSGNTVFIGNISETINEKYKSELARKIFSGEINGNVLQKTLTENKIKYLFIGYQEGFARTDFSKYPFLKNVFQNSGVTLYKVSY
jgi:hypothetical protein